MRDPLEPINKKRFSVWIFWVILKVAIFYKINTQILNDPLEDEIFFGIVSVFVLWDAHFYLIGAISPFNPILSDQVVLVTGGTSGIGSAAVRKFAILGATVVFTGRRQKEAEAVIRKIKKEEDYCNVTFFKADQQNFEDMRKLAEFMTTRFNRLDILVNNAGMTESSVRQMTVDGFEAVLQTNYLAAFYLTS
jgi:hypothetical protein